MKNGLKVLLIVFGLSFLVFSNVAFALQFTLGMTPSTPFSVEAGKTQYYTIETKNTGGLFDGNMNCTLVEYYGAFQNDQQKFIVNKGNTQTTGIYVNTPQGQTGVINTKYVVTCQDWIGIDSKQVSTSVSYTAPTIQFTVTPSKNTLNLFAGQSETVSITISNQMSESISCDRGGAGSISAGGSQSYSISVQAPSTGSGTTTQTETVMCSYSGSSSSKSATITVNYQSDPCVAALANAKNTIADANVQITNAKNKIQEANNLGADVTNPQATLNKANEQYSSAQTSVSTAQTTCNSGDKVNGPNQANNANNYATQAKSYATDALNSAQEAITTLTKLKTDASNKISSASSATDTAKKAIKKAESLISNATILGMDTTQSEADVTTARLKSESSDDYYKEATSAFESKNFELAKSKSASAESYAKEAENLATSAYNSLWNVYAEKRVGAEAILNANTQVSKMNEIMTKMDYVLRKVKDYNIDLAATQSTVDDSKTSVDSAEDSLSQAKNRLESGYSDQAAELAVQAKTQADSASNRLDTIVTKLKFSISDALKLALKDKQKQVSNANSEVKSAETTYGADSEKVIEAQRAVSDAETKLKEAESTASQVETAESLSILMQNAEAAFTSLDEVGQKVQIATSKANEAKIGLYATVGAVGATAAAVGGGFLYWRRRKNKPAILSHKSEKQKHEDIAEESKHEKNMRESKIAEHKKDGVEKDKMKTNVEKSEDEKQKGKFCHKCGSKLEKHHKFCPKCGAKTN